VQFRLATDADVPAIAETIALAFVDDPAWGPILRLPGDATADLELFWAPFVRGALRYDTVWVVDDGASVAVWLPSGADEMTDGQLAEVQAFVDERLDAEQRGAFAEIWESFEHHHPAEPPHMYLSLLATHPSRRGEGLAQQLLAENLRAFAERGLPAYLESTNPDNDRRYARAGFREIGSFTAPIGGGRVATMWCDLPE